MPLHIVVGLNLRDKTGAKRFVRSQYARGGANLHDWLTPAQFTQKFSATAGQAAAVANYLKQHGFTNVKIEPNRLIVSATGSVSRVEAAFHTSIKGTRVNGKVIYANVEPALAPAKLRGVVAAVLGLQNDLTMHTHNLKSRYQPMTKPAGTPPPCGEVVNGICLLGWYGPPQYQVAYDATCSACSTGKATKIAVMAEGDVSQVETDLRTAETFWKLPKVRFVTRVVGAPSSDTSDIDEWDIDTQISSGIADKLKALYVYAVPSLDDSDITSGYEAWVQDNKTQAGNSSFGEVEAAAFDDGALALDDSIFTEAVTQGMTMFASTGDSGSGCPVELNTGAPVGGTPDVCYPASSPYVVAVGGTTLDTNANGNEPGTYYGEHVWVGTGGGYSAFESAGYWQANGICAVCTTDGIRGAADIAMCADNNGCPMDVFISGVQTGVGGTSLSSPMSMGVWARLETKFNNKLGFAAPVYYGVYGYYEPCPLKSTARVPAGEPGDDTSAAPPDTTAPIGGFNDILFGTNGIPSSAGPGWDEPTGLGTVNYYNMQQDIQNSIFPG
ncbi:MAG: S8/S53 family peptidase [Candidatus Eremiobacteraeota bacterium]|nr:S8/S53 family peptidase [Candidatus Eremiobacteraeota bacterium]